eukprot:14067825-Alexandrium_andersonii.AAC.1
MCIRDRERNGLIDRFAGSGYGAAQDIIDGWSLRLADEPECEEKFQERRVKMDVIWRGACRAASGARA